MRTIVRPGMTLLLALAAAVLSPRAAGAEATGGVAAAMGLVGAPSPLAGHTTPLGVGCGGFAFRFTNRWGRHAS